jgi:large subunit ribosomal protein L28
MAKVCDILGIRTAVGNTVSHSNIKTKRKFFPNLQTKKMYFPEKDMWFTTKLSTKALRTINKIGVGSTLRKAKEKGTLSKGLLYLLD